MPGFTKPSSPRAQLIDEFLPAHVVGPYFVFGTCGWAIYHHVSNREYSSILTMSAILQALGTTFICLQVLTRRSATGISARGLVLDAVGVALRLSSTLWLDGYLPTDASGDGVYQIVDLGTLAMLLFALHLVLVTYRCSYQDDEDASFPAAPVLLVCFLLAALFHGTMNDDLVFDILWMTGLFTSVVAVLPQFSLIVRTGLRGDAMTCHYIATIAASRVLSGMFMWAAREDIDCKPWVGGFQHAIVVILIAHLLHLTLIFDFLHYYITSIARFGFHLHGAVEFNGPMKFDVYL